MLKKMIAIGISLIMISTVITGCGSTETSKISKKEKLVTLTYHTIGRTPIDIDMVEDEVNKYLEEKINVNIDMQFTDYGDYDQKTSIMINSGEDYDLMFTCSWAGDYLGNSRKGAFLELTPYLDTVGKDMYEAIDPRFWQGSSIDGKIFAVPNQKEIATMPVWRFTKEYVDKYNVPYTEIKTLEDLEPWLEVIKQNEPDVEPYYIVEGTPPNEFDFIVNRIGIEFGDDTLTVKNLWETDQFKEVLKTLKRFYEKGYISKTFITDEPNSSVKRFVSKADGQPYADILWSDSVGYDIIYNQMMDSVVTNSSATGSMIAINSNSKNPEKAVEFINLLNTDPYLRNLLNFGIEGIHYDKVEGKDNVIKLNEQKKDDYGVASYTMGNLFITYLLDKDPETKWEEFQKFNEKAVSSPILGFKLNTDHITNELAIMSSVISEYEKVLYSGSVDVDKYLAEVNKKLYDQGMQKVIDEIQKQLDEWLKTQK